MSEDKNKPHHEAVCPGKKDKLDLVQVQADIEKKNAPEFWRSLEELAASREFREMMHREFPKGASEWVDSVSRRGFFKLMGASLALAGMTACEKQPFESIVPYVKQPEGLIPGKPMFYATAFTLGGYATPLLVTSREFRPIKIEGNDRHQASLGGTDVYAQASILDLYDPDRSQGVSYLGNVASWESFYSEMQGPLTTQLANKGTGLRILSRDFSSPTLVAQMQALLKRFPQAKWHYWEAVNRDNVYEGARMAFGQPVETTYKLDAADVVVSLDADFLYAGFPGMTRYARDFASRRDPDSGNMSRFYAIESTPTNTGAKADHRLAVRAADIESVAAHLANASASVGTQLPGSMVAFLGAVTQELNAHRGASVVIPGEHQPPVVHALCHAINQQLGNVGKSVFYSEPLLSFTGNHNDSLKELISDMKAGKVEMLIILGANPVYDAPADFGFYDALKNSNIPIRIHHGLHNDETAELCHWHLPESHYLEAWGDTRAYDGTVSLVQPLIAPLYESRSAYELLAFLAGQGQSTGYEVVQNYWKSKHSGADFDLWWRKSLEQGWVDGTASQPKQLSPKTTNFASNIPPAQQGDIELNLRRDPSTYDGRFANNGWLQELPKPMTKVTWDNPLMMSPAMADRMGVKTMDMVRVTLASGKYVDLPVWIQAGHPDNSVTAFLGYGRQRVGRVGNYQGFDLYPLRYSDAMWFTGGVKIQNLNQRYILASTQGYQTMDVGDQHRPIVRVKDLEDYKKESEFDEERPADNETLYNLTQGEEISQHEAYAWGMAIDLNKCVGCNNCIIACQAENNIAIVGKDQVNHGRHMHWLRVDAYYQGDRDNPRMHFMPVPCMQCEDAPCELVCPVGATTHSTEGLNDMIYNRCVGTRYCSNNCPYKVRRFNFFLFQDWNTPQFKMQRNPDVSVRSRGVMEKCTYCVQRITHARIDAEEATTDQARQEPIAKLQTACQQSCPANAIVFGNLNDPNSEVSKWKKRSRNYGLLDDLNTRPRTTYSGVVSNPNPQLEKSS